MSYSQTKAKRNEHLVDDQLNKEEKKSKGITPYLTDRVIIGGLVAINVIILQDLLSLQSLDTSLRTTALAISIALPLLIGSYILHDFFILLKQKDFGYKEIKIEFLWIKIESRVKIIPLVMGLIEGVVGFAGQIATLIGLASALFHILPAAGQAFIITTIIIFFISAIPICIAFFRELF